MEALRVLVRSTRAVRAPTSKVDRRHFGENTPPVSRTRPSRSARRNVKQRPTTTSNEGSPLGDRHDKQPEVKWRRNVQMPYGNETKQELTRARMDEAHATSKTSDAATRKGSSWNSSSCSAWRIRTTSIVRTMGVARMCSRGMSCAVLTQEGHSCFLKPRLDLAQNRYFEDPAFVNYLHYLLYWKQPKYAKYIVYVVICRNQWARWCRYPHALFFLDALQDPEFRRAMVHSDFKEFVHKQQYFYWRFHQENVAKEVLAKAHKKAAMEPSHT